ncbi:MAG: hypothetical protein WD738_15065 [Pirellulales bacterium]
MGPTTTESDLKTALTGLETSLSTPIVSGELAAWMGEVQKAWQEASAQIHYSVKHLHQRQYDQMAKEDLELLPRIELLKVEDEAIEQQREHISQMVARDAQHVPKLEPDEGKAQKHVQSLIDEGLAFITRVRKQEVAVQTWLLEAFNRDRGAVD